MNPTTPQIDRHRSPLNELQFKTPMPVSVVIPCYNESDSLFNLAQCLADLRSNHKSEFDFEFVFVNDGSTDETDQRLHDQFGTWANVSILRHAKNLGMTAAIMTGVAHAANEAVCSIDSDCTYPPELVTKLVPLLGGNVVLATASPYHPRGKVINVPRWRIGLSYAASLAYRQILRNRLYCYTCGVRAYRRSALLQVHVGNGGFVGTTELLWRLEQRGWQFAEYPATLSARQFGHSKMRTARVMFNHLKMISAIAVDRFWRWSNSGRAAKLEPVALDSQRRR
jgi:dolichol-phosphate mannosyltransferase